jgi:hypothetical protein
MNRLLAIAAAALLLLSHGAAAIDLTEHYQAGDKIRFVSKINDRLIGIQEARCLGLQELEGHSLLFFELQSTIRQQLAGRKVDINLEAEVGYQKDGRPQFYRYEAEALGRSVIREGWVSARGYAGQINRFGVETPFIIHSSAWPLLLDSHFPLQWETTARFFRMPVGDSSMYMAVAPQADTAGFPLIVRRLQDRSYEFEGRQLTARVYDVSPANQLFYVDEQGRLLRAHDRAVGITVERAAPAEELELESEALFDTIYKRLPWYALLLLFAVAWLLVLAQRRAGNLWVLLFLVVGAVLAWPALKLILINIALWYERALAAPGMPRMGSIFVVGGLSLLLGTLRELIKLIPIGLRLLPRWWPDLRTSIAVGAAVGAGFGFLQEALLTSFMPDGSLLHPPELWQRFATIGLNTVTGAMMALFIRLRWFWTYFLIPIALQLLSGWPFVLVERNIMSRGFYYVVTILVSAIALLLYVLFHRRAVRQRPTRSRRRKR